jgi:hypothetical protein
MSDSIYLCFYMFSCLYFNRFYLSFIFISSSSAYCLCFLSSLYLMLYIYISTSSFILVSFFIILISFPSY